MSRKKEEVRNYKFSDSFLKQKADGIALCVERDATEFLTRKVTLVTLEAFKTMITDFDESPGDEILQGNVSIATEVKDSLAEALRVKIRTIRCMAENVWGIKHPKYRIYRFDRINETSDDVLHRLARTVLQVATDQLTDLAAEGLTQAMIDDLKANDISFDLSIDTKGVQTFSRDISSQDRIAKGNMLFKEMLRLCNIGKDLFAATNESKYNDYVIYDTPSGTAPAPAGSTGAAHGTALHGNNHEAVVNGLVFFDGVTDPIEVDEDGSWEYDLIPLSCTKIRATADFCVDYEADITITAGQDTEINIDMVDAV